VTSSTGQWLFLLTGSSMNRLQSKGN
jgi:hypothetical protein